ncbi:MAG: hypothetical protein AB7P02_12665 [Alphaproteobacteria bacterium]
MPPFDAIEDVTAKEEALLRADQTPLPPADDPKPAEANDDTEADEPAKPEDEKPALEAPAEEEGDDDQLAAFMEKHKGKSAEELLRIAYQQSRARQEAKGDAKRARADAQAHQERLAEIATKIKEAREARLKEIEEKDKAFEEELRADPDAATRRLHQEHVRRQREELDNQAREEQGRAWQEFVEQQRVLTRDAIPDFETVQEELVRYAIEERGYTPNEIMAASDHRDIVTLDRARRFDALVKAGVIDAKGNFLAAPSAPAAAPAGKAAQARQILQGQTPANAPRTLSDTRGVRPRGGPKALRDRAKELADMSDMDFSKVSEKDLEALLRDLG